VKRRPALLHEREKGFLFGWSAQNLPMWPK
jgi:hypothetical protein